MKRSPNLYECHSCLMESTDPVRCTHCGVLIQEIDISKAMFIPPVWGYLVVEGCDQEDREVVRKVTDEVASAFFQSFYICEVADGLRIKCDNFSASLLISKLEQELPSRKQSLLIYFEGKPE